MTNLSRYVTVRELAGWELDENEYRPPTDSLSGALMRARSSVLERAPFPERNNAARSVPAAVANRLVTQRERYDLHREMRDLEWSLGVVDLRDLLAFQRRLIFDAAISPPSMPAPGNWDALTPVAFASPRAIDFFLLASGESEFLLQSANPDLQLRRSSESCSLTLYGGSPFLEAAEYRGRWFLRDGYHRAYYLLRAGVFETPAVLIRAKTLAELGSVGAWFFPEETLLSSHPPQVTDFLNDALTIEYMRPRLLKTLRISIEESFAPELPLTQTGEQL